MIEVKLTDDRLGRVVRLERGYSYDVDERNNLHVYTEKDNGVATFLAGVWAYVVDLDPDAEEDE